MRADASSMRHCGRRSVTPVIICLWTQLVEVHDNKAVCFWAKPECIVQAHKRRKGNRLAHPMPEPHSQLYWRQAFNYSCVCGCTSRMDDASPCSHADVPSVHTHADGTMMSAGCRLDFQTKSKNLFVASSRIQYGNLFQ